MFCLCGILQTLQTWLLHTFPNPFHLLGSHSICAHQVAAIPVCLAVGLAHFGLDCRFWKANFSLALNPAILYSAICNLKSPLYMPTQSREMHVCGLNVWGDKVYVYVTSDKASPHSYCFRNS